jgi:NarL family two-component system response regulator LiaR
MDAERHSGLKEPEEERKIRVMVIDDHSLVREGTKQLLEQNGFEVVGEAATGTMALAMLDSIAPDVVLVDINLPEMDGLELTKAIKCRFPTKPAVAILTAYDDSAYVSEALDLGVKGYLLKTSSAKELCHAIRAVNDGVVVLDKEVSQRFANRRHRAPSPLTLTVREVEVLTLLAKGYSNKQIASELYLSPRTVEGYISNLLTKLDVKSRTEAVICAISRHLVELKDNAYTISS